MVDIALHVRIFEGSPNDEFVTKRQTAIKEIAGKFLKPNTVSRLFSVANGISLAAREGEKLPADLAAEVGASIIKVSPSFVPEGHDLELSTCAMLAAVHAIETGSKSGGLTSTDYLSVGLWSGMSLQQGSKNERFERLRQALLEVARDHVLGAAQKARVRATPAKLVDLKADNTNLAAVVENLGSISSTLTSNAAVDREEIDLLWWSISGWSESLEIPYSEAKPHSAAIALGLDAARHLRRMPLALHKALVLRRVPDGESQSIAQLLTTIGEDRTKLAERYRDESDILANTEVFPLLNALISGSAKGASKVPLSISDVASRALLEAVAFDVINRRGV